MPLLWENHAAQLAVLLTCLLLMALNGIHYLYRRRSQENRFLYFPKQGLLSWIPPLGALASPIALIIDLLTGTETLMFVVPIFIGSMCALSTGLRMRSREVGAAQTVRLREEIDR